jgi:hypothetical protein
MSDREIRNQKIREIWREIARRSAGSVSEPCPDPEILSAYSAKMLSEADTARWETHFSVCAACQETLVAFAFAQESVSISQVLSPAIPLRPTASHPAKATVPPTISLPGRALWHTAWYWLAPAMAAAIVLVVWLTVRGPHLVPLAPVEVAQRAPAVPRSNNNDQGQATQKAADVSGVPGPVAAESVRKEVDNRQAQRDTAQAETAPQKMAPPKSSLPKNTRVFSVPQLPGNETLATKSGSAGSRVVEATPVNPAGDDARGYANTMPKVAAAASAPPPSSVQPASPVLETPRKNEPKGALGLPDDQLRISNQTAEAQRSRQSQEAASALAQTRTDRSGQMQRDKSESKQKIDSASQDSEIRAHQPAQILPERATAQKAIVLARHRVSTKIFAPDRQTLWIVGPAGTIQRSTNGGRSVVTQNSGVLADLLAGSAPTQTVCWVVGQAGTILLTTDAEHWARVGAPGDQDWIGVRAIDASSAVIWDEDRHATFSTSDGGKTWKSLP